ncbi:Cytochrome b5 [Entophlyctis luteolus]|nr:Cytochrome b5 [Entophlyctis luteolus]
MEGADAVEVTAQELGKHASAADCWMAIHGKVYNVTAFLSEHPGGEEILVELAGQDATEAFDDIGHSNDAKKMLVPMLVGRLAGAAKTESDDASKKKSTCIIS